MTKRNWVHAICAGALLADSGGAAQPPGLARPSGWPDNTPLGERNVVVNLDGGARVRVDVLSERLFRIRYSKNGAWTESALNRYGILGGTLAETAFEQSESGGEVVIATRSGRLAVSRKGGSITLAGADGGELTRQPAPVFAPGVGFRTGFTLARDERVYGLGDVSRDNVMRRGGSYELWVRNVKAYIPVPVLLSSRGWGLLMNTTWRNTVDIGKSDPDRIVCTAASGDLDYYLFCGPDYRSLLDTYTSFSGRPALLPVWGYALTYVCNENIDAFHLLNEALTFRRERLPCDVIGLEPGWMSRNYDGSTAKQWHPQRFPIPAWAPRGPHTFLGALDRKGFKLSLWLCCDYDLGVYEEQLLAGKAPSPAGPGKGAAAIDLQNGFEDPHLGAPAITASKDRGKAAATPPGLEPWFEHLRKFVDQGVSAFKLDGSAQVIEHPSRKWGNGMTDEEMHNLYPVIYAKQMARGFEDHARRRAMIYSAGGYAGVQQFVATWAGDTGGGPKPLASMLNLGFSGHSNHSCDMDVSTPQGIHFGFLQTWAQQNNWAYWYQPWLLKDEQTAAFRSYAQLRYRLLPYIYSAAAEAAFTGYPVMRAMPMACPDDPSWDACLSQYMLGDSLLVSVFSKEVRLPKGAWYDFWSGRRVRFDGPATVPVEVKPGRGGALLVKSGAIIPTWPPRDHVETGWSPEVGLLVYPAAIRSGFTLYEDDGQSLAYREGKCARTRLACETDKSTLKLTIGAREGGFSGMPASRDFVATIHVPERPRAVTLDGVAVPEPGWDQAKSAVVVRIPACGSAPRVVVCQTAGNIVD